MDLLNQISQDVSLILHYNEPLQDLLSIELKLKKKTHFFSKKWRTG